MCNTINRILKRQNGCSFDVSDTVEITPISFFDSDLFYSLQHISYRIQGKRKNNKAWSLTVCVYDTYNFDTLRCKELGITFANLANDLGYIMERVGMLTTYAISVSYSISW